MRIVSESRRRQGWPRLCCVEVTDRKRREDRAQQGREASLRLVLGFASLMACMVSAAPQLCAQASNAGTGSGAGQSQPTAGQQNPAPQQQPSQTRPQANPQTNANPFPEDTNSVPVMPTRDTPDLPPSAGDESPSGLIPMPAEDTDPMRGPEDTLAAAEPGDRITS